MSRRAHAPRGARWQILDDLELHLTFLLPQQ